MNNDNPYKNIDRDDATLGTNKRRQGDSHLADGDQPTWQPPESQPEPRPADPILKPTQLSNPSTNINSPA